MRSFLICLVGVVSCCGLSAQARHVSMELEAGGVVAGRVVSIDSKTLVVEVDGEQKTYSTDQIRKYRFTEVEGSAAVTPATPVPSPFPATRSAPLTEDGVNKQDPAGASAVDTAAPVSTRGRYRSLWDRRLGAIDRAYPWLFPAEPMQWISLGVMLFSLLSLAVHFAARLAATDYLNFGRATGLGMWLLLTGIGQMAVLPQSLPVMIGAVAGNIVGMVVLYSLAYGLSVGGSLLAVFLLSIEGGIGFALLQLVDATLRSIGNTTF